MNPLEYIAAILLVGGHLAFFTHYADRHPLAPWEKIGSANWIEFQNPSTDSVRVYAMAPEVDSAVRFVGVLGPQSETFLRLPYADTKVTLLILGRDGGTWKISSR